MKQFDPKVGLDAPSPPPHFWVARSRGVHGDQKVLPRSVLFHQGCYSHVGRAGSRRGQILSLGSGCVHLGTVLHEMLHAAGFWHEQSRPDRDEHVSVQWRNIRQELEYFFFANCLSPTACPLRKNTGNESTYLCDRYGMEDNFARYSRGEVSTLDLPYETDSVMHYRSTAFSRNGRPTLLPRRPGGAGARMGQREVMTELDLKKLNRLYGCDEGAAVVTTTAATVVDPKCRDRMGSKFCYEWFKAVAKKQTKKQTQALFSLPNLSG